ncbi:hypothetical protein Q8A67_022011 [Cirrhinus molitorella]|uniref:Uncharacterized protein n=1 Tax=Cirrhinus molitorella TaxID=172907 RepID=A0AA88TN95_9TELE|nr:hypothetical protein Q8A67_022011 [Cirrhinus molitorella]
MYQMYIMKIQTFREMFLHLRSKKHPNHHGLTKSWKKCTQTPPMILEQREQDCTEPRRRGKSAALEPQSTEADWSG